MSKLIALETLISSRKLWRGQPANLAPSSQPTGHAALDAALPTGGWPEASLTELLLPMHGVGELRLMWPALARLSQGWPPQAQAMPAKSARAQASHAFDGGGMVVLIDPPFEPYAPAWRDAGVALSRLQVIRARGRDALWAAEQCLRSGACAAVLCWPQRVDDRALRRLQVAAETGQCLGFALRDSKAALNPSPAALRIAIDTSPRQLRVLKCRGGNVPTRPIPFASTAEPAPARMTREQGAIGAGVPADRSAIVFSARGFGPDASRSESAEPAIAPEAAKPQLAIASVSIFPAPPLQPRSAEAFRGRGLSCDAAPPAESPAPAPYLAEASISTLPVAPPSPAPAATR
ncbi:hypothetical protein LG3211_2253 [Lysobacter gummosus]|nr:hypothetical protein LG3211_2253 [Lysobacter gummosus]